MLKLHHLLALWAFVAVGCMPSASSSKVKSDYGSSYGASDYGLTMFSGSSFACSTTGSPYPPNGAVVGITEKSPLLPAGKRFQCIDTWRKLDFGNPPWQGAHYFSGKSQSELIALFQRVPQSYRQVDGQWQFNEPDCTTPLQEQNLCGMSFQIQATGYKTDPNGSTQSVASAPTVTAYVYDACPANHWNNSIKELPEHPDHSAGGNPCEMGARHLDLKDQLWSDLQLPSQVASAQASARLN